MTKLLRQDQSQRNIKMVALANQHLKPKTDIAIAQAYHMQPIVEIAQKINIQPQYLYQYGPYKAKIAFPFIESLQNKHNGKLILVTGISPTQAGEGKTTTTIGLGDGLTKIGKKSIICLREPSLGPCFGMKGGAAGGGYAQVVPMEEINLHFTGDFHAISAAHNLLSAMLDNHIYWGNALNIDPKRVVWKRVIDMNDRALRKIALGFNADTNTYIREDGFDITVASEVMAIFCLAQNISDLQNRIGNILVAYTTEMKPIYARDLDADGAMTALLKDALQPNIVQTLEATPAFIHGGPFANIAHGCSSVIATKTALKIADYVVTEAGFGADLGAEKFFDIKCRSANLIPDCVVIVATIRALKMHGGVIKQDYKKENLNALKNGFVNLERHVINTRKFGVPVLVALNRFSADTQNEFNLLKELCDELNVSLIECDHWAQGGAGCVDLAHAVVNTIEQQPSHFKYLYDDSISLLEKVRFIAQNLYGAKDIQVDEKIYAEFSRLQANGYGHYPVCIAKTPVSFSTDASLLGAPSNHSVPIKEIRLARGAEFVVVLCGDVMTMPGLPHTPAANNIKVNSDNQIEGLF